MVAAVQPSSQRVALGSPIVIIGSIVKVMPGLNSNRADARNNVECLVGDGKVPYSVTDELSDDSKPASS